MEQAAFYARISGMVQGVGFRYFAQRKALALGLSGYVRNLPDGTVEVYAEGQRDLLENFLGELHQGPEFSRVDEVKVEWREPTGKYETFVITY